MILLSPWLLAVILGYIIVALGVTLRAFGVDIQFLVPRT